MSAPRAVVRVALAVVRLLRRGAVWLVQAVVFVVVPLDELVTAWLGIAPVLPRFQRWRQRLVVEWRAYRAGVVEGEVMDGVWR